MRWRRPAPRPERLVLHTSPECGLCEEARRALRVLGLAFEEVEVPDDHPFRLRTPVVTAGGRVLAEGRVDEAVLRRALRRAGRSRRRRRGGGDPAGGARGGV